MEGGIPFAVGADVPALDDKQFWARLQAWREEALPGCGLDVDPIHHATVKFILLVGRLRFLILSCVITKPYGVREQSRERGPRTPPPLTSHDARELRQWQCRSEVGVRAVRSEVGEHRTRTGEENPLESTPSSTSSVAYTRAEILYNVSLNVCLSDSSVRSSATCRCRAATVFTYFTYLFHGLPI